MRYCEKERGRERDEEYVKRNTKFEKMTERKRNENEKEKEEME